MNQALKQILLVEDDQRIAGALSLRLRQAGYAVTTASNPVGGIELALAKPPDLIITDMKMPAMHGLTFVNRLKRLGLAEVPFVVITASYRDGLWESAMGLGAAAYFEKPYDPEKLLTAVIGILNQPNTAQHSNIVNP